MSSQELCHRKQQLLAHRFTPAMCNATCSPYQGNPADMGRRNEVKDRFAALLRSALIRHFKGQLPSNAVIAREFNLRAYTADPVTQESVRRWVQGISMPDETKMRILVSWLDLDVRAAFDGDPSQPPGAALRPAATIEAGVHQNGHGANRDPQTPELTREQARMLEMLGSLSQDRKKLLIQLAKKLSQN